VVLLFTEVTKPKNSINSFQGDFRFLSNFYKVRIWSKTTGIIYPSAEHAYQANKTLDLLKRNQCAKLASPYEAKAFGKRISLRDDWEDVKLGVMYSIVKAKFEQNPFLAKRLLQTGETYLIEGNTWGDFFWGVCNGIGENHLGDILMRVRERL
jgi:ribA/ribD-fused uncharacterized protein